ncbi:HD family phosphohydrolase [candidate division KSB1 bacterium]
MKRFLKNRIDAVDKMEKDKVEGNNFNNKNIKALIIILFIFITVILFPRGKSYQYADYKVGTVIDKEIIAPFNFPILKTEKELRIEKENAIKSIHPYFFMNQRICDKQLLEFDNFIDQIYDISLLQKKISLSAKSSKNSKSKKVNIDSTIISILDSLKNDFKNYYNIDLDEKKWNILFESKKEIIDSFKENVRKILNDLISIGIINKSKESFSPETQISYRIKDKVELREIDDFLDEREAKENASKRLRNIYSDKSDIVNVGYEILNIFIYPNVIYDEETVVKKIGEAVSKLPLAKGMVLKGERIVDSHEIVTEEVYDKIASLRVKMFEEGTRRGFLGLVHYFGKALFIGLLLFLLFIYIYIYRRKIFYDNRKVLLILIIVLIQYLFAFLITNKLGLSVYLIPTTISSMLLAILFDSGIGFIGTIVVSLGIGGFLGSEFTLIIVSMISGIAGVFSVYKVRQRSQFFQSIFFILLAYFISLISMGLFRFLSWGDIFKDFTYYALPNSIFSPIITLGMLYIFEWAFGITTNMRLLELSDLNHPLLRQLSLKAPGTYHHSILVGNLAESAADAIGANSLLARVGAYYHDIGKMIKPEYFTENQEGPNPHDKLAPSMSCLIISSHVKEGIEIGKEHKIPNEILDFIKQHQGTGKISFFYEKAKQTTETKYLNEMDFRYLGPKPQTKEAGILMLSDSVDAALKSLKNPSVSRIKEFVGELIESKFKDGQLDECELTFKDLRLISDSYIKILAGMFHARVEYPSKQKEVPIKGKGQLQEKIAQNKNSNNKQ